MQVTDNSRKHQAIPEFVLRVGSLASIASLHSAIAPGLLEYNRQYLSGSRPAIRYDLTDLQPHRISMAALTALLATMDRFREFAQLPASLDMRWNPQVFGFLSDIGFFAIGRERDLFEVDAAMSGGFASVIANPNTQIICSEFTDEWSADQQEQAAQKDAIRTNIKEQLLMLCGGLFRPKRGSRPIPTGLRDQILVTSAELVVNAHLWGKANAFVGLQRSSRGITVSVCDSGEGFLSSLSKKRRANATPETHLHSLAVGSIINAEDFGLRRAIDMVTRASGRVEMSSFSGEIIWRSDLWGWWVDTATRAYDPDVPLGVRFEHMRADLSDEGVLHRNQTGQIREWAAPLRGSRVTFEVPILDL